VGHRFLYARAHNPGQHGPNPRVLGCRGPRGCWIASARLPRFSILARRLWQVENSAEQACSQVEAAKRMLHETLATVSRDILHTIRVSLKKVESLPERLYLPSSSLTPPCLCFYNSCPRALQACPRHRRR
jgi:hypothetical protein